MDDLISRKTLLAEIMKMLDETDENISIMVDVVALIRHAPAADVASVRHGKWLLHFTGVGHYWECSECHTNPCIYVTKDTKFCPKCGAKMDLKEESYDTEEE